MATCAAAGSVLRDTSWALLAKFNLLVIVSAAVVLQLNQTGDML
jgi:hypothetical protein